MTQTLCPVHRLCIATDPSMLRPLPAPWFPEKRRKKIRWEVSQGCWGSAVLLQSRALGSSPSLHVLSAVPWLHPCGTWEPAWEHLGYWWIKMLGVNDGGSKTDYVQCLKARKKKKCLGSLMEEPGMAIIAVCCSQGIGERNVTVVAVSSFENWRDQRN